MGAGRRRRRRRRFEVGVDEPYQISCRLVVSPFNIRASFRACKFISMYFRVCWLCMYTRVFVSLQG